VRVTVHSAAVRIGTNRGKYQLVIQQRITTYGRLLITYRRLLITCRAVCGSKLGTSMPMLLGLSKWSTSMPVKSKFSIPVL
jgi:hypothetical protein